MTKLRLAIPAAIVVLLALLPLFASKATLSLLTEGLIWALLATAFNLIFGHGGMVSLGHAAFLGIGAYTVSMLVKGAGLALPLALLIAPVLAGALAALMAPLCVRLTGLHFAMLTLALAQLVWIVAFRWYDFTRGDDGYWGVPRPDWLDGIPSLYMFTLGVVLVAVGLLWILSQSSFGRSLRAVRDNPGRAEALGIWVKYQQSVAFVISGFFAGLAGGLYGIHLSGASPELLYWTTSAKAVVMSLIGGMFTFTGPAVGAMVMTYLIDSITRHTIYSALPLGILLAFVVLSMPGGIMGYLSKLTGFDGLDRAGGAPPDKKRLASTGEARQ